MMCAGDVLRDKFKTWSHAFGDITWAGYKKEVKETFTRTVTLNKTISRGFSSVRAAEGPGDLDVLEHLDKISEQQQHRQAQEDSGGDDIDLKETASNDVELGSKT